MLFLVGFGVLFGCKESDDRPVEGEACEPTNADADEAACASGLACEPVGSTGDYVCAAPLEIHGQVVDAWTLEPIAGAHIAALDEGSAPVTDVVESDAEGRYVLSVSARRDPDGQLADSLRWTLQVSAVDYYPFPHGVRPAIPVNSQDAVEQTVEGEDDDEVVSVIEGPVTTVGLIPLTPQEADGITISGSAGGEAGAGSMVVAEGLEGRARYGIADASGAYTLFNVPAGDATIRAYRAGAEFESASVSVAAEDLVVDLTLTTDDEGELGQVEGSVNIVNAPGGSQTTVVLIPVSVYNEVLERGPVPWGLRSPPPPDAPDVSSAFAIEGVPAGTYKVLAAFENDALVRDPDDSIAGTQIQEISIGTGETVTVEQTFKVTEALPLVGPGPDAPEVVGPTPTFRWQDDSSETHYGLVVFDALGELVWEQPSVTSASEGTVEVLYAGPALDTGMAYQFRVTSFKETPQGTSAITRTEDLRGVFVVGADD